VGHHHARDYRVQDRSSDVQPNRVESPDVVALPLAEGKRQDDKQKETNGNNDRTRNPSSSWLMRG
jgi:hypothetical protein